MSEHRFPADFLWGAATSAQQIEGGRHAGGRGDSIWDRFATAPGRIADGTNPDVACDHYHRWHQDIALMAWLGLDAYRFSISWPRVFPGEGGTPNPAGLDFYDRLVDGLLAAGIQPFPTLYHWDLPQWLQERGGWPVRETAHAFVAYCETVVKRLGDRVRHWVTHNEPWCAATLGHEEGQHAPGHRDPAEALRAAHHLLLSHGWATEVIRRDAPGAEVGIVLIHCPAYPASDREADREAARWFDGFFNRWYLDPLLRGSYPADAVADRVARGHLDSADLAFVKDGDLVSISSALDFLGLNYYSRAVMHADADGRPLAVKVAAPEPLTLMGWEDFPEGLRASLERIHREYWPGKIYITENGAAYADTVEPGGRIRDRARAAYLRGHLLATRRAIAQGVPVKGYFVWSLLDNFEWAHGYTMPFGLFAVDFQTQKRTPKDSAAWYRDVVAARAVEDASPPASQGESHEPEC
jgi:beta-glucosidase